jgi:hypothetical protein
MTHETACMAVFPRGCRRDPTSRACLRRRQQGKLLAAVSLYPVTEYAPPLTGNYLVIVVAKYKTIFATDFAETCSKLASNSQKLWIAGGNIAAPASAGDTLSPLASIVIPTDEPRDLRFQPLCIRAQLSVVPIGVPFLLSEPAECGVLGERRCCA